MRNKLIIFKTVTTWPAISFLLPYVSSRR